MNPVHFKNYLSVEYSLIFCDDNRVSSNCRSSVKFNCNKLPNMRRESAIIGYGVVFLSSFLLRMRKPARYRKNAEAKDKYVFKYFLKVPSV